MKLMRAMSNLDKIMVSIDLPESSGLPWDPAREEAISTKRSCLLGPANKYVDVIPGFTVSE